MYVSYVSSSMCLMALISSRMSRGEEDMPSSLVFQICLTNIMTCALSISPPISTFEEPPSSGLSCARGGFLCDLGMIVWHQASFRDYLRNQAWFYAGNAGFLRGIESKSSNYSKKSPSSHMSRKAELRSWDYLSSTGA